MFLPFVQVVVCSCSAAGMLREGRTLEAYVQGVAAAATHAMRPGAAAVAAAASGARMTRREKMEAFSGSEKVAAAAAAAAATAAASATTFCRGCIEFTHVMVDEAGQVGECILIFDLRQSTLFMRGKQVLCKHVDYFAGHLLIPFP